MKLCLLREWRSLDLFNRILKHQRETSSKSEGFEKTSWAKHKTKGLQARNVPGSCKSEDRRKLKV